MKREKLARDLQPGDLASVSVASQNERCTVLAVVPTIVTVERKMVVVTFRRPDGTDLHRTFGANSTVRIPTSTEGEPR